MITSSRHIKISFLTLFLLCFAVALASCSKKDVRSNEGIEEIGDLTEEETSGEAMSAEDEVGSSQMRDTGAGMTMAGGSGGMQTVYFDYDRYSLRSDARSTLKANADWLKAHPKAQIQIEGHCDERGTVEYNLALGERRANAAKEYLTQLGVAGNRMSVISYGEERPANPASNEAAWAENRRTEFVILSQ